VTDNFEMPNNITDIVCGLEADGLVCDMPKGHQGPHEAVYEGDLAELLNSDKFAASTILSFEEWLAVGIALGFCTSQWCMTHDTGPMHISESRAWEAGGDPCCHVVRLGKPEDWDIGDSL
jgi:hypothetical protein